MRIAGYLEQFRHMFFGARSSKATQLAQLPQHSVSTRRTTLEDLLLADLYGPDQGDVIRPREYAPQAGDPSVRH